MDKSWGISGGRASELCVMTPHEEMGQEVEKGVKKVDSFASLLVKYCCSQS